MSNSSRPDPCADELLAVRCQLGERDAFDALIARWHEPIWRYLRTLCDSDDAAADLAQDTWLRVLRGLPALRDAGRFRAWLFGIARRAAMDRLRARYAQALEPEASLEDLAAPEPDEPLESDLAALRVHLDTLPLRDRETLALFYLRELGIDEIATLLNVPAGTVKSRLFRARQMLRDRFNPGE